MNNQPFDIIELDTINSTNSFAKKLLKQKKIAKRTIIIAKHQTNGCGRQNRSWDSKSGDLCMTIVIPNCKSNSIEISALTLMAVIIAIEQIFEDLKNKIEFKWPNDILFEGKKICGILPEQITSTKSHLIIGIGLNLCRHEQYHSINKAISPKKIMETIINLFNKIECNYKDFGFNIAIKNFLYSRMSSIGKQITINKEISCVLDALNDDFSISVFIDGGKKTIYFAEIL